MATTAWFGESLKSTALAAANLSANQFYAVTVGVSGVALVAAAGVGGVKVLVNKPQQGDPAQLWDIGETKMIAGAAVTVGQILMTDSSGRFIPWVDNGVNVPIGECRSPATQAGELFTGFIWPTGAGATPSEPSAVDGLTAAGTNQATALQLTANLSRLTTVSASTGAALIAAVPGAEAVVVNAGASTLAIYGNAGNTDTIDGTAGSTGVTLSTAHRIARFTCFAVGKWVSDLGGAVAT